MILQTSDGLLGVPGYEKKGVPVYFTDDHLLLEGPTYWIAEVSKIRSKSIRTLSDYSTILARYLQWLDDQGYGSLNWQNIDRNIIDSYTCHLLISRNSLGKPRDSTIESYMAKIASFYKWATKNGYKHYWDMEREIKTCFVDSAMMVLDTVDVEINEVQLGVGAETHIKKDLNKFLTRENFSIALDLMDDEVYKVMSSFIWITALRPKELLQVPYKGKGKNLGLKRYRYNEVKSDIPFHMASKGKNRSIEIPAYFWQWICDYWMPLRTKRAELFKEKNGYSPSNSVLFLSSDGRPVTYRMLSYQLGLVGNNPSFPQDSLIPKMFRHSFATYFVLEALKARNMLNAPYVYDAVIDNELREWMGHTDTSTTYKYYVHLVHRYIGDDLIMDLRKEENQALLNSLVGF